MGNAFIYLVSFTAAIGGLLFGYEIGVISQVLGMESFELYFGTAGDAHKEWKATFEGLVTSTFLAGCALGSILVIYIADKFGRKYSVLSGSALFSIGGFFQALAKDQSLFFTGRVLSGLGIGLLSMVVPVFIAEMVRFFFY